MKTKTKIGWKCVSVNSVGTLRSAVSWRESGVVDYAEKKWTTPIKGDGPLTVFMTRAEAMTCASVNGWTAETYRCKYISSKRKTVWSYAGRFRNTFDSGGRLPMGTRLASKVMLLNRA